MKIKADSIIITEDQLLDPSISVETVNKLIYEGNVSKLVILSTNPIFVELNQDAIIAMGKIRIIWYKNTEVQIGTIMSLTIISLMSKLDFKFLNLILFSLMIFLFLRLNSYHNMKKKSEMERIIYIQKILKESEYSIDHLITNNL